MVFLTIKFLTNELLLFVCAIGVLIYLWFLYKFSYWSKKGVFCPKPSFPFGNIRDVIERKSQFFQPYCDNYFKYRHLPYMGMYCFNTPVLSLHDPEIIKLVLIKDFEYFQSHGIFSGGVGDPLASHLFNIHGKAWRNLRLKMSPTFTASKLKTMYPLVDDISNQALQYADKMYSKGEPINFSEFYAKYSMEIIGSVGFGVKCDGFNNPDSEFYLRGQEYFEPQSFYWTVIRAIAFLAPDFFKKLRINRINPEIISFFKSLVHETVDYRYQNDYKRNDFLQTLIDLKDQQAIFDKGDDKSGHGFKFTMTDVVANTMLYMFAGYETSATTGQFAAYELALNPHIQAKAREEVRKVLAKHNGQYTYEAQNEMVYLNMVLDETMRKHPPLRALFRRCTKEYKMPNGDLVIDKGTLMFIPLHAIHMDPEIYPKPEVFDPERFSPENKAKLHPCSWMPFGEGPRKCLGLRQGYIQSKMALVKLLNKYEFLLDDRTQMPMKLKTTALACTVDGGVWIKLKKL